MDNKRIITIQLTAEQAKFLEDKKKVTGESVSSQIRRLITKLMKGKPE